MNLVRKCALAAVASVLGLGLVGITAPSAHAADSSWGCGGYCKTKPSQP